MEKDEISKGLAETDLAGSCEITVNDAGTCEKSGTRLTQWRSPRVRTGKVYFIQANEAVKIGYSLNPEMRLGELQVGSQQTLELIGVMDGTHKTEGELHAKFAHLHIRGEWFHSGLELLEFIESVAEKVKPESPPRLFIKPRGPSLEALAVIGSLIRLRSAHKADTPIGHCCSTIVEQIKEMANYVRPEWAKDERQTLPWMMQRSMTRLSELKAAFN